MPSLQAKMLTGKGYGKSEAQAKERVLTLYRIMEVLTLLKRSALSKQSCIVAIYRAVTYRSCLARVTAIPAESWLS